jgi:hypothetical protein
MEKFHTSFTSFINESTEMIQEPQTIEPSNVSNPVNSKKFKTYDLTAADIEKQVSLAISFWDYQPVTAEALGEEFCRKYASKLGDLISECFRGEFSFKNIPDHMEKYAMIEVEKLGLLVVRPDEY